MVRNNRHHLRASGCRAVRLEVVPFDGILRPSGRSFQCANGFAGRRISAVPVAESEHASGCPASGVSTGEHQAMIKIILYVLGGIVALFVIAFIRVGIAARLEDRNAKKP